MAGDIQFVMTGSDHWTLRDGSRHKTGFWAEEAVAPLEVFRDAGYRVTVATPGGVRPPVDESSLRAAHLESDGNLLTGQNPASSESLARAVVERLTATTAPTG